MRILFLCESYPSDENPYAMSYVHSRALGFRKNGIDVKVGSFSACTPYSHESVRVDPANDLSQTDFDVVFSHAPNLRNHIRFLLPLHGKRIVFVIHGHEVLRQFGDYPPPYDWQRPSPLKLAAINAYDTLKLSALKRAIRYLSTRNRLGFIFVSEWMKEQFIRNIGHDVLAASTYQIIPNPTNDTFSKQSHRLPSKTLADFITIRPLDSSKYAIDLVVRSALGNPHLKYHIYGRGKFFNYTPCPNNVSVFDNFIDQKEIPKLLNRYKAAMMPTRYDSQGVMNCEIATYGMPLITTDVPICREMLSPFSNVRFVRESDFGKPILWESTNNIRIIEPPFDARTLAIRELNFAVDLKQPT